MKTKRTQNLLTAAPISVLPCPLAQAEELWQPPVPSEGHFAVIRRQTPTQQVFDKT